jgi:aminopeptidase N
MLSVRTGPTGAEAAIRAALLAIESYEIFLDLTGSPGSVRSRTEVRFVCRKPGASSFADLTAPVVHALTLNGTPLDRATVIQYGRVLLAGLRASNTLVADAEFPYSQDANGIGQFTDPADGAVYVMANCFPVYAPRIFCCFDQPDLRAGFSLSVLAPAGWDCVANGAVRSRPAAGAAGLWRFVTVPAMKPYELALCAGPYVTAALPGRADGSVSLTVRSRRSLADSEGLERVAEIVRIVIDFYGRHLGVPCPYPKVDITFPPDLGPNAMQLPGAMFVSETLLERVAKPDDELVTMILAHEVAHLWFGCLVEGRWWDDLWLAEAMATYVSYVACEQALGRPGAWAEFAMSIQPAAYRADSVPSAEAVAAPVASAADAMSRPMAIIYGKGASVIRQLAAFIGADALRSGMSDYLIIHAWSATTLTDLVRCWSRASGRDLTQWAAEWLQQPGVDTLRPELAIGQDGRIAELAIALEPPPGWPGSLRSHQVEIGVYDNDGAALRPRAVVSAQVTGARSVVPELAGGSAPAAIIVNHRNLTFARSRFDQRSLCALTAVGLRLNDPLTEAACWNAAWDMTTAAELPPAAFVELVTGRIQDGQPLVGLADLLALAVMAADLYSPRPQRAALRRQLAASALAGASRTQPGSENRLALAAGFASSAEGGKQLATLRSWVAAMVRPADDNAHAGLGQAPNPADALPGDLRRSPDLHARALRTLAAAGLASGQDLEDYAAADHVGASAVLATCRALRPEAAAKEEAWAAALAADQLPRLARAWAEGFMAPGQEQLLAPFTDRYFTEALPSFRDAKLRSALRLARLLYPAMPADPRTLAMTDDAIGRADEDDPFLPVLIEQRALLAQVIAARAAAA